MYRVNPLLRNVLITTDEVIFHGPTQHTLDSRTIEQSIIVAEERIIRPTLGFDFYEELITQKNTVITDANKAAQQVLLDASFNVNIPDADAANRKTLVTGDVLNAWEYLTSNNQELWKQLLWKLTAEVVLLLATAEGFVQFTSSGTVHNQPASGPMSSAGVVTPELRSVKWIMDKKMMDRIDPLRESMHLWLCKKKKADTSKYPLYTNPCDCNADGVAYQRKTDVILGIYDDEDNDNNCCDQW